MMNRFPKGRTRAEPLKRWLPWLVFPLTFTAGTLMGLALYRVENEHHEAHQAQAATERIAALQTALHLRFRPVQHLATVLAHEEGQLGEPRFRRLAQSIPLVQLPGLLTLQWLPLERNAAGEESFPVRYRYRPPTEGLNGVDDALDAVPPSVLTEARQRRELVVVPWHRVDGQVRFRAVLPVFRIDGNDPPLLGFVAGLYRVEPILAEVLCPMAIHPIEQEIDLSVSDPRSAGIGALGCQDGAIRHLAPDIVHASPILDQEIVVDGTTWTATTRSHPDGYTASLGPLLVVSGGSLLLGAILSLYLRALMGREAQVKQLVQQRTWELARRTEQLQALNNELEQFTYVASHDLKAPLRAISQLASSIEEDATGGLDPGSRRRLQLMRERVVRMDRLIEGLLAYSRAGRPDGTPHPAVALGPLLDALVADMQLPPGFQAKLQEPLPTLGAAPAHLRQVFENLISNAARHHDRPGSGTAWVSAEPDGRYWRLEVADDGPSIPPHERERVFGLFTSAALSGGQQHTALGLAIVKKLVLSYGGRIDVVENQPRGARFRIWWPR